MDGMRRVFDAHLHIIDPAFPVRAHEGFVPEPFTADDYRARMAQVDLVGGAVVSSSFHGMDQSWLVDALRRLGDRFVGVAQVGPSVTDEEIRALAASGVRAIRYNVHRGGPSALDGLDALARRVHELAGWHVELYVDSADLPELAPRLHPLPLVVVDHLGLTAAGFDSLLRLVESGVWVKASGFGRVALDVRAALSSVYAANPSAVVFGTDLPGTRARRAFRASDIDLVLECLGEDGGARVLCDNALRLYGLA